MRRYPVLLTPDPGDGGLTTIVGTFPGCVAEGHTLTEALDRARDAIRFSIEDLEADGKPVPEETVTLALATVEA